MKVACLSAHLVAIIVCLCSAAFSSAMRRVASSRLDLSPVSHYLDKVASLELSVTGQDAVIIACQLITEVSELEKAQAHRESDLNFRVRAISALRRRDLSAMSKRF